MKKLLLSFVFLPNLLFAQLNTETDSLGYNEKMEWFRDAKLGIFIHWGIYAVNGISESWSFYNGHISHSDYIKQADGFTARNYDPDSWARLIKASGARYSVITTKHHDGFALWDTKYGGFNVMNHSAAKKDLITPFVRALRENGMKTGLYFSLPDWSYLDYTDHTRKEKRYKIADDPGRWEKYSEYYFGQLQELKSNFNPDLWWFDGDWEHSAEEWNAKRIRSMLSEGNPRVIFNARIQGHGDYETPEIGIPVYRPKADYWELCMTMNDSWGYQVKDSNFKTPAQVIDIFVDCISKGGNLLLDIGPKEDGSIPEEQVNILSELGRWTKKHAEAVYGTRRGIPYEHFYGPTSLSKDSSILYLYVRDITRDGKIAIKGIKSKISKIYVVGHGRLLEHKTFCSPSWSSYPGIIYIDIPDAVMDEYYTVIAIVLDDKLQLYCDYKP